MAESWHILCVEPNREVTAHAHLVGRRFRVYLPMVQRKQYPTTHRKPSAKPVRSMPMFRGYCFARFDPAQSLSDHSVYPQFKNRSGNVLQRVRSTTGVRGLLTINGQFATLSEAAITGILELEQQLAEQRKLKPASFVPGQMVRTTDSDDLYAGLLGIVERVDKQDRVVLSLLLPGRAKASLKLLVSAQRLEPVSEAPRVGRAGVIKRFA
jgi:transcription antitermination factor NusG